MPIGPAGGIGPAFADSRITMRSIAIGSSKPFRGTGWLSGALLVTGVTALGVLLRRVGA